MFAHSPWFDIFSCFRGFAAWTLLVGFLAACGPSDQAVKAGQLMAREDYAAALTSVKAGLAADPGDEDLMRLLLHLHLALGERAQAVQAYRQWEMREGRDGEMLRHLGLTILRWGLGERDPAARLAAIQGVRQADAAPLLPDMLERLSDPDEVVRTWAAVACSRLPQGAEVLEDQTGSPSAAARALALTWIAKIAGDSGLEPLLAAQKDPAPEVRAVVAMGLGAAPVGKGLAPLLALGADPERTVRAAAFSALGRLSDGRAVPMLTRGLDDAYLAARLASVEALAQIAPETARPLLRKAALGADLFVALAAGKRLAKLGEPQPALEALARALLAPQTEVREAACNMASSVADRAAGELLKRGVQDAEPRVRLAAARALRAHGQSATARDLARKLLGQTCTDKGDEALCSQAAQLLLDEEQADGMRTMARLAQKARSARIRLSALRAALRGAAGPELALGAAADPDPEVALEAATWLYLKNK